MDTAEYIKLNNKIEQMSSSGGHTIENASGTALTQRDTLQFKGGLSVSDDSTNEVTVVNDTVPEIEWSVWNAMTPQEQEAIPNALILNAPDGGGGDTSACANKTDISSIILTGTTNTSGSTITAGTWFYLNGEIVKAKVDIASNATFTLNTNYEKKTIGAELTELNGKDASSNRFVTGFMTYIYPNLPNTSDQTPLIQSGVTYTNVLLTGSGYGSFCPYLFFKYNSSDYHNGVVLLFINQYKAYDEGGTFLIDINSTGEISSAVKLT